MNDIAPVPRKLVLRLWYAVGAGVLFLTVAAVHAAIIPGFDARHQSVSALAIGPFGWLQAANFVVFGGILISTVSVWQRILSGGPGAIWYPRLTAVLGITFALAGCIPQDPAPGYDPAGLALQEPTATGLLHLAVAGIAAVSSVASMFVMATRLASEPAWRGWATYSRVMGALVISSVVIYGVWSTRPSGYAGMFERLAIVLPTVWAFGLVHRMWRGTPLMRERLYTATVKQPAAQPGT